jgi:hypothetical protein
VVGVSENAPDRSLTSRAVRACLNGPHKSDFVINITGDKPIGGSRGFLLRWIVSLTLLITIGLNLAFVALAFLFLARSSLVIMSTVFGLITGIFVGLAEWVILRKYSRRALIWGIASPAGLACGAALLPVMVSLWHYDGTTPEDWTRIALILSTTGAVVMLPMAILQGMAATISGWRILAALIWAAVSTLAGALGLLVYFGISLLQYKLDNYTFTATAGQLISTALVFATFTGLAMTLLRRYGRRGSAGVPRGQLEIPMSPAPEPAR